MKFYIRHLNLFEAWQVSATASLTLPYGLPINVLHIFATKSRSFSNIVEMNAEEDGKMNGFEEIKSLDEMEAFIQENKLAFLYFSQPNCSVCHGLFPQVEQMLQKYPNIAKGKMDVSKVPEVAGQYSILTVPVLLLFVEGKEYIREARIVQMQKLNNKISIIYENMADQ